MRDMTIEEFCDVHGACGAGLEWALAHCTTMQECWEKLTDPIWITWVASQPGVLTANEKWRFGLFCCELVHPQLTDFRSFAAISILRLWLTDKVGLQELKLASWGAAAAWDEEEGNWAAATVATAICVPENAISACVPNILDLMHCTVDEDIDPARLANWLRTFTKPNFTQESRARCVT